MPSWTTRKVGRTAENSTLMGLSGADFPMFPRLRRSDWNGYLGLSRSRHNRIASWRRYFATQGMIAAQSTCLWRWKTTCGGKTTDGLRESHAGFYGRPWDMDIGR